MGKISQMITVRTLLHKMRTHTVVSIVSAVTLVTLLCGFLIHAAMKNLDAGSDTVVEEGDFILTRVTEVVEAETLLQAEEVSVQLETLRLSLSDLHGKVDMSAEAFASIEGMIGALQASNPVTGDAVNSVNLHLSMLQTEITNAFDKIEAVSNVLAEDGTRNAERSLLLITQMEDINQTMTWISEHYASVSEEMIAVMEVIRENGYYADSGLVSQVATLEDTLQGGITEFTAAAVQLQTVSEQLTLSLQEMISAIDMTDEVAALQAGLDDANRKLDLLLAGGGAMTVRQASVTGDAEPWQVLAGRTYTNGNGDDAQSLTGTMPDHSGMGPVVLAPGESYTLEEGYYPALTIRADGTAASSTPDPSAGTLVVSHHVHSSVSTRETVQTGSMDPSTDGPADDSLSQMMGGCYMADAGEHTHTAACYTTQTRRVEVNPCRGSGGWSGPYGPDSQGKEYYVADCVLCGARVGTSYTPVSGSIGAHTAGMDHMEYTNQTTTVVTCGMQEGRVYAISCGHCRGDVMSYTMSFE